MSAVLARSLRASSEKVRWPLTCSRNSRESSSGPCSSTLLHWVLQSYDALLRASEALIFSRLIMEGSNSIVILFENALISASMTPGFSRSRSSKSNGRSPSFVLDRSRIPRARWPAGTASVTASLLTVLDCTIVSATGSSLDRRASRVLEW